MTAVVLRGDAAHLPLPDASVDLICCSPPYFGLRSYTDGGGHYDGQVGSEATPAEYIAALVECTAEWVRVLKPSGSLFVNLGDKYSGAQQQPHGHQSTISSSEYWQRTNPKNTGIRAKSLMQLPQRYSIACTDQLGLILRSAIIWSKPNGLPESVQDRCRSSHEYLFHFTVRPRYYAAVDEIREPHIRPKTPEQLARDISTRRSSAIHDGARGLARGGEAPDRDAANYTGSNPLGKLPGSVWEIPSQPLSVPAHLGVDHFAAFPMELPRRVILGWSPPGICTECGEGRRPVVTGGRNGDGSKPHKAAQRVASFDWAAWKESVPHTITGYACGCPDDSAPTRPAVVVDPFGGTGTTALVASMLGRTGISVDLSADYCRLARWRTTDPAERARALQVPKPPPVPDGQVSLFDDLPA